MSSTFKKELKKRAWKTLKFTGEEKAGGQLHYARPRDSRSFLDRVSPFDRISSGVQKETCVNARDERKRKSNEVQISPAMTNNIQLNPMMLNQIKCRPHKSNYYQCPWLTEQAMFSLRSNCLLKIYHFVKG
jgi:hypothetical protein